MRSSLVVIFLCVSTLIGCGTFKAISPQQRATLFIPDRFDIDNVPFYAQKAQQCGPAVLAMALTRSGVDITPDTLVSEVFTPSLKGSLQSAIIATARRFKRVAYPISGIDALLRELAADHPVIVLQNLGLSWIPVWHYSLAVGYNLSDDSIRLHSGQSAKKRLSLNTFERTWARSDHWGLLVLPPTRLPATADHDTYLSALSGLEKSGCWNEALQGYQNALNQWPESYTARIGRGNCHYALGNRVEAEAVFRETTLRFPDKGAAFNNLAQVLLDRKKFVAALDAIQKAISIGGPLSDQYRKTLQEIKARISSEK